MTEHQREPDAEADVPAAEEPPAEGPSAADRPAPVQVRIRRAPKYRSFVIAGAAIGVLAAVIIKAVLGDGDARFSASTVTGYLAAIGLLIGGLLGAAVAVLVEHPRRPSR